MGHGCAHAWLSGRHVHNLHDAAAANLAPARDIPVISLVGVRNPSAAEAREDVVNLGHETPINQKARPQRAARVSRRGKKMVGGQIA